MHRTALFLVLTSLTASAQSVHVVDEASGPGSTHSTITDAIAAANDGDFVLIREGTYDEDVVLDGKGLRMHAEAGADVLVNNVVIRNLGASQTAVVGGLRSFGLAAAPGPNLLVEDNQGSVRVQLGSIAALGITGAILRSSDVVLQGTELVPTFIGLRCSSGTCYDAALTIEESTVALFECEVEGLQGDECTAFDAGTIGLLATDSDLWLVGSTVEGGRGACDCGGAFTSGDGGNGLELRGASTANLVNNTVQAGAAGCTSFGSAGSPGMDLSVAPASSLTLRGNVARRFTIQPVLRSLEPSTLTFRGRPDDVVYLLIASEPTAQNFLPSVLGPLAVARTSFVSRLGRADASGDFSMTLNAPPVANGARTWYLQGSALNRTIGEIVMGTPTQLHVLDSSF